MTKKFPLLFCLSITFFLPLSGKADDGIGQDLCRETCAEKERTERQEGCAAAYDSCANACPSGWAGKACMIPCRSGKTSCEKKASKNKTDCIAVCAGEKKSKPEKGKTN